MFVENISALSLTRMVLYSQFASAYGNASHTIKMLDKAITRNKIYQLLRSKTFLQALMLIEQNIRVVMLFVLRVSHPSWSLQQRR